MNVCTSTWDKGCVRNDFSSSFVGKCEKIRVQNRSVRKGGEVVRNDFSSDFVVFLLILGSATVHQNCASALTMVRPKFSTFGRGCAEGGGLCAERFFFEFCSTFR